MRTTRKSIALMLGTLVSVGMLAAATVYEGLNRRVACAKLHHQNNKRCIFCEHQHAKQAAARLTVPITAESTLARSN